MELGSHLSLFRMIPGFFFQVWAYPFQTRKTYLRSSCGRGVLCSPGLCQYLFLTAVRFICLELPCSHMLNGHTLPRTTGERHETSSAGQVHLAWYLGDMAQVEWEWTGPLVLVEDQLQVDFRVGDQQSISHIFPYLSFGEVLEVPFQGGTSAGWQTPWSQPEQSAYLWF